VPSCSGHRVPGSEKSFGGIRSKHLEIQSHYNWPKRRLCRSQRDSQRILVPAPICVVPMVEKGSARRTEDIAVPTNISAFPAPSPTRLLLPTAIGQAFARSWPPRRKLGGPLHLARRRARASQLEDNRPGAWRNLSLRVRDDPGGPQRWSTIGFLLLCAWPVAQPCLQASLSQPPSPEGQRLSAAAYSTSMKGDARLTQLEAE